MRSLRRFAVEPHANHGVVFSSVCVMVHGHRPTDRDWWRQLWKQQRDMTKCTSLVWFCSLYHKVKQSTYQLPGAAIDCIQCGVHCWLDTAGTPCADPGALERQMWHFCLRSSRWWPVRPYCRVRRWQVWFLLSTDRWPRPNSCGTPLKRWRRYRGLTPRLREHRRVLFCPRKRIVSMKCYLESVSEAHLWLWLQLQSCWMRRLFGWNCWRPHTGRSHYVLMWFWQGYKPLFM